MKRWMVEVGGKRRDVRLVNLLFGRKQVWVDGRRGGILAADALSFQIDGHPATLQRRFGNPDEIDLILDGQTVAQVSPDVIANDSALISRRDAGGSWFYWIAGLSILNAVVEILGGGITFIVGLGFVYFIHGFAQGIAGSDKTPLWALIPDVLVAALFVGFGVRAKRGSSVAFVVGMLLYSLDAMIFLLAEDLLGLAFHALALFFIFRGWLAARTLVSAAASSAPA